MVGRGGVRVAIASYLCRGHWLQIVTTNLLISTHLTTTTTIIIAANLRSVFVHHLFIVIIRGWMVVVWLLRGLYSLNVIVVVRVSCAGELFVEVDLGILLRDNGGLEHFLEEMSVDGGLLLVLQVHISDIFKHELVVEVSKATKFISMRLNDTHQSPDDAPQTLQLTVFHIDLLHHLHLQLISLI